MESNEQKKKQNRDRLIDGKQADSFWGVAWLGWSKGIEQKNLKQKTQKIKFLKTGKSYI